MFSIIIGIIGVGQYNLDTDQDIMVEDYPSYEYDKLKFIREDGDSGGLVIARRGAHFLVNFLFVLRYSLGDYGEFREIQFLTYEETIIVILPPMAVTNSLGRTFFIFSFMV